MQCIISMSEGESRESFRERLAALKREVSLNVTLPSPIEGQPGMLIESNNILDEHITKFNLTPWKRAYIVRNRHRGS